MDPDANSHFTFLLLQRRLEAVGISQMFPSPETDAHHSSALGEFSGVLSAAGAVDL